MKMARHIAIVLILPLCTCTPSKQVISWKNEFYQQKHYNKILVLGLMPESDRNIRENMETELTEDLNNQGTNAIAAIKIFGLKPFSGMDEDDAMFQLNNICVEAVLTLTLLDKGREMKYFPGNTYYTPFGYYYDRFWRYRTTINNRISGGGNYYKSGNLFYECNLYDMITQKLVYSVQTKSFDTADFKNRVHEYGQLIAGDLIKKIF